MIGAIAGGVFAADLLLGWKWRNYRLAAGVATFPVIVVVMLPIARRLHRWLTASLAVMRREVAVSLAKEYFEKSGL